MMPFETHRLISCIRYWAFVRCSAVSRTLICPLMCVVVQLCPYAHVEVIVCIASSWTDVLTEPDDIFDHSLRGERLRLSLIQLPAVDLMPLLNQSPCPPLDSSPCDPALPPRGLKENNLEYLRRPSSLPGTKQLCPAQTRVLSGWRQIRYGIVCVCACVWKKHEPKRPRWSLWYSVESL